MKTNRIPSVLASVSIACMGSLMLIVSVAEAKTISQAAAPIDVLKFVFDGAFLSQVMAILGVIMLDWSLGVALAVRDKKFEFKMLADFYRSQIMPKLIGWVAFTTVLKLAAYFAVGDLSAAVPLSIAGLCFAIVMVALVADVATKAKDLLGTDVIPPYTPPATK
jgi:hypothetical protein